MNTRALHEPDTETDSVRPKRDEVSKGRLAGVVTPARMGVGGLVLAVLALVVVVLVGRSRRQSKLKDTVLHLPGQVDHLIRRGVEQLAHVTG